MSTARRIVLVGVLSFLTAACSSSSTGPTEPDLVGTWNATKAEFIRVANPATKLDLVALGGTMQVVFAANNTFTVNLSAPGAGSEASNGTWSETATTLTLNVTSNTPTEVLTFAMALSGNTLSLTGATASFNFGGGDEPATVNLTLVKQ